jgi:hypothetical protein
LISAPFLISFLSNFPISFEFFPIFLFDTINRIVLSCEIFSFFDSKHVFLIFYSMKAFINFIFLFIINAQNCPTVHVSYSSHGWYVEDKLFHEHFLQSLFFIDFIFPDFCPFWY